MPGIYFHIPFCKQKCSYCNFYSVVSQKYRNLFVDALLHEITVRRSYLSCKNINTIYFGGGTPSMLSIKEINKIIDKITTLFKLNKNAEITLEANPDDLSYSYLSDLKNYTKVNRLSIGVQSFYNDDLKYLNRVHSGEIARQSIENTLKAGFKNVTIDLIYGIPTLTLEKWHENLSCFFNYNLPHLSAYALTVEYKTALQVLIDKKKLNPIDENDTIKHFEILQKETQKHKFIHYEISNFAKEKYYSKHNSIYWLGDYYLGLGPSAHSFNGTSRQWNVSDIKQYVNAKTVDEIVEGKETLTFSNLFNEYIMTSLRTTWGCDVEHIENVFGYKMRMYFEKKIKHFVLQGNVIQNDNVYTLTDKGKLFADGIASNLFYE